VKCKLFTQYDYKEVCAPSQSQVNVGVSPRLISQDDVSHQEGTVPLSLPQINLLLEDFFVWDETSDPNTNVDVIPSKYKVTQQILIHWYPFLDLKPMFPESRLPRGTIKSAVTITHSVYCCRRPPSSETTKMYG
jgi:hypothetical protein